MLRQEVHLGERSDTRRELAGAKALPTLKGLQRFRAATSLESSMAGRTAKSRRNMENKRKNRTSPGRADRRLLKKKEGSIGNQDRFSPTSIWLYSAGRKKEPNWRRESVQKVRASKTAG